MKLTVRAPCCFSRRSCFDTAKYVVDVEKREVITEIPAIRCYRGVERYYEVEIAEEKKDSIVVVEHYVSNRNVHYLRFEHPKQPSPEILSAVKETLGLIEAIKLVVR